MKLEKIPELTTISEASRFTGMDFKTIKKRIENLHVVHTEGRYNFYDCFQLLRNAFIKSTDDEKSELNLTQEKAWYYRELTEKVRIEKERLAENLMDAEEMMIQQTKVYLAFKEKLLSLSVKLGPRLSRMKNIEAIIELLETCHKEVLLEIGSGAEEDAVGEDQEQNEDESKNSNPELSPTSNTDG
ncbi:MAG: hypothetical protein AB8G05_17195 [Oligoflexales bacterium]